MPNPWEKVIQYGESVPGQPDMTPKRNIEIVTVDPSRIVAPKGKVYLPYQHEGIQYALSRQRVLIADEMGLGKTIQAIGVMNTECIDRREYSVLVICPKSLIPNWMDELAEWRRGISRVHVCHYEGLRKLDIDPRGYDLVVVDEAHYIKNPKTQRSKQVTAIAKDAKRLLLLTGTPILNSPIDLFPILELLAPEVWNDYFAYARKYCDAKYVPFITKSGYNGSRWDVSGASNLGELSERLHESCMIRRMKADVLTELPEKRWQVVLLDNSKKGESFLPELNVENYNAVIKKLRSQKVEFEKISSLRHEQALAKVPEVIQFVEATLASVPKVILFAHHWDVLDKLYTWLQPYGVVRITGETSLEDRGHAVDCFTDDPNCRVFLGSMHAAGVGLNLTVADTVIFAEADWSPSVMNQCADRAHRIKQKNAVNIYILVLDNTLDARIMKVLVKKQSVIERTLG